MKKEWTMESASVMPVIALRGLTVFPNVLIHFDVAREISIKALEEAMSSGSPVFLVGQKDISEERPEEKDLYTVGTISNVRQILRTPGDNVRVMVEGVSRGSLERLTRTGPYLEAEVQPIPSEQHERNSAKAEALIRSTYELFQQYTELAPKTAPDLLINVLASEDPGYIADFIAQNIAMRNSDKQAVLEELRPVRRLERLHRLLGREVEILGLDMEIQNRAREQMADNQRDYYLREQMKAIQNELGEGEGGDSEIGDYRRKIAEAKLPDEVREKLEKEVGRLAKQPFGSSEATVLRSYLDVCLELPWGKKTRERVSVEAARRTLDKDHFGLEKVKERILEFLAVKQLAPDLKGQVICLVGPPGVGKTSVAMSVARALNRKLARLSLGGVSDEAEIRGHRKTYIGAMPGRIMDALRRAGTSNPLILLDEIDKMGNDFRGDPASAMLEVLDTEQNVAFRDHYIELPFDLSDVVFLTTANDLSTVPRPLLDRMEAIELPSYTAEEKRLIARRHLLSKQMKKHGLSENQLIVDDETLDAIISGYTREAGVRRLEQVLAKLCRKAAKHIADGDESLTATKENLEELLGTATFKDDLVSKKDEVGIVNGLAWTSVGGEMLEVEVAVVPGTGKIEITGNLGTVMQESAKAAVTFVRSKAEALNIDPMFYKDNDLHIHFPEAAIPKDGPSAGVTITTALISALTGAPVRHEVAMTGEVTLRGRVLPIGGLREKTMAAYRAGIKTVCIPKDNESDLKDIVPVVRENINFVIAEHMDTVVETAIDFSRRPKQKKRKSAPVKRAADSASTTVVQ